MFVIVIKNHRETKQLFESKYFQFKIISVGLVKYRQRLGFIRLE